MSTGTAFNIVALTLALAISGLLGFHALWVTPAIAIAIHSMASRPADAAQRLGREFDSLSG